MKLIALALLLAPIAAFAQTDAMPPATRHAAHSNYKHAAGQRCQGPRPRPRQSLTRHLQQGSAITLTIEDLLKLPQTTITVRTTATPTQDETYTGPLVSDVLARAGLASHRRKPQATILHSQLSSPPAQTATTSSTPPPKLSNACFASGKVIVAVMQSGLPISNGGIQLINTTDSKPVRWVHGLAHLNVMALAQSN